MLHVTTEIGIPGKHEREKRHFPHLFNQPGIYSKYIPRGRRYIPHGNGYQAEFIPHNQNVNPKYSVNGPDWTSSLRWIPAPQNENYRPEIWPEPWKALRTYPGMSRRTTEEWAMYPEGYDVTMRCTWEGIHKASSLSADEFSHFTLYGNKRKLPMIDTRNGLSRSSYGDKCYKSVEYSPDFHKFGSTLPVVNFGGNKRSEADTFVPLQEWPLFQHESYKEKELKRQLKEERRDVEILDQWRPATPLIQPAATAQPTTIQENKVAM